MSHTGNNISIGKKIKALMKMQAGRSIRAAR